MRIRPYFRWYDLWCGCFLDRSKRRLYLQLLPCLGVRLEWGR